MFINFNSFSEALYYTFYKNNVMRTQGLFCSKFNNMLRTIPASAEEQQIFNL